MGKLVKLNNIFKKKPKLTFGRPIARTPKWENQIKFQAGVSKLSALGYGIYPDDFLSLEWWGNTVASSRNKIFKAAIGRDSDYVIFVDDDMTFMDMADDVEKLLALDKDIVGTISPTKGRPHWANISKVISIGPTRTVCDTVVHRIYEWPTDKPFEVDIVGTSFMAIKKKVFKKMTGPWFYMPPDYEKQDIRGEDSTFCFNAKMHGFEVWVDPTITVPHIGDNGWQLFARSTCFLDFKDMLIKDAQNCKPEILKMAGKDKIENLDHTHNLVPEVQEEMRKGLGPGKMFV